MNKLVVTLCLLQSLNSYVKAAESCDELGILAYEEIGCKPVYNDGQTCPLKFECEDFKPKNGTCLFGGRSLKIGEKLDDDLTYDSCNVGCFCENPGEFECAALDCPEWLGDLRENKECYSKFEIGKCCSVGEICPSKQPSLAKCKVDDKDVLEGQEFYPKNTCMRCVCPQKGFNGKFEAPHCKRRSCGIQVLYAKQLDQKCAPVYTTRSNSTETVLCCPEAWVCPTDSVEYTPKATNNSTDLTCQFGDKTISFGDGLTSKLYFYGNYINVACKCQLPPMLTCKEI